MKRKSTAHVWTLFFLGGFIVPLAGFGERDVASGEHPTTSRQTLARAAAYLWGKQSPDGSWRSETYGLLKSGQSFTPFVLFALSNVPVEVAPAPEGAVEKAMAFLRSMGNDEGVHGRADPDVLDYPNYATAYALRCFLRFGNETDGKRIENMVNYLLGQQFAETTGFKPESPAYGGWGFGINRRPTLTSFVDLSHTRRVLAALAETDRLTPKVKDRAERFLALLQKSPKEGRSPLIPASTSKAFSPPPYDGGFFSSPNVSYANKGRIAIHPLTGRPYYRSYATATCDGILALLAVGVPRTDPRVRDATRWLQRNEGVNLPQGIPAKHPEPWAESMIYYHLAVRAQAHAAINLPGNWRKTLIAFLSTKQNPDGSFLNPRGRLMKEDDPILCSALATLALSNTAN